MRQVCFGHFITCSITSILNWFKTKSKITRSIIDSNWFLSLSYFVLYVCDCIISSWMLLVISGSNFTHFRLGKFILNNLNAVIPLKCLRVRLNQFLLLIIKYKVIFRYFSFFINFYRYLISLHMKFISEFVRSLNNMIMLLFIILINIQQTLRNTHISLEFNLKISDHFSF